MMQHLEIFLRKYFFKLFWTSFDLKFLKYFFMSWYAIKETTKE